MDFNDLLFDCIRFDRYDLLASIIPVDVVIIIIIIMNVL